MADEYGNLGHRYAKGVLGGILPPNVNVVVPGAWLIRFPTDQLPTDSAFEMYSGIIIGPGGEVVVYVDDIPVDNILNGRRSTYAPKIALYVYKGREISFHWTISSGTFPQAWIWLRKPEVGRI